MYQDNEHFEALNCFKEDENLDTLDKEILDVLSIYVTLGYQ
jgi:hypothetical protein